MERRFVAMRPSAVATLLRLLLPWTFLLAVGCGADTRPIDATNRQQHAMSKELVIDIGQNGDEVVRRSGLPIKRSKVSTALLYDASPDRTGREQDVVIVFRSTRTKIPVCETVLFYDNSDDKFGVERVDLHLKMPTEPEGNENITALADYDRQVYGLVVEIIQRVNAAGWQRFIGLSRPRLGGADALSADADADPTYVVPWAVWHSNLPSELRWKWYLQGAFLRLHYERDRSGSSPRDTVTVNIESERIYLTTYDPKQEGNADAGIQTLRNELPAILKQRRQRESEAEKAGRKVLKDWTDPPIGGVEVPAH